MQKTIIHIEDNLADVFLTQKVITGLDIESEYLHFKNGLEGLNYLKSNDTSPSLILLDINMPIMDGKEFLKAKNDEPFLRYIPVVIFSSSCHTKDLEECYNLQTNGYIQKTMDLIVLKETLQTTVTFWLKYNVSLLEQHN